MSFPLDATRRRTLPLRPSAPPSARAYRIAATILFAVDGAVFGSWAGRIPDVAANVGAGPTALGLALLCVSIGALASMQLTGALCARLGTGVVATGAAILTSITLALPGLAGSVGLLAVGLLVFGVGTGALNVAANAVGVRVEAAVGRPVLPSLHAGFSFGGLAGAGAGALVAAAAPPALHLLAVAATGVAVSAAVAPTLLAAGQNPVADGPGGTSPATGMRGLVIVLGVIAGCTAFAEGTVTDWGGLRLDEIGASPALASAGYAAFSLAMAIGRLAGSSMLRVLGPTGLVTGGALLAATGAAAVATLPVVAVGLAGFVLIGLGLANVFPIAIARAGAQAGPAGVARASTVGYTGLLGGPPLLGILAEAVGMYVAFSAVALLGVLTAGLAVLVRPRAASRRPAVVVMRDVIAAGATRTHRVLRAAAPGVRLADPVLTAAVVHGRAALHRHAESLHLLHAGLAGGNTGRPVPAEALAA